MGKAHMFWGDRRSLHCLNEEDELLARYCKFCGAKVRLCIEEYKIDKVQVKKAEKSGASCHNPRFQLRLNHSERAVLYGIANDGG